MAESSPFYRDPPRVAPKERPKKDPAPQQRQGPSHEDLEGWYRTLHELVNDSNIVLDTFQREELEDVRDAIYAFLR